MLQSSAHDRVRPLYATSEHELWKACPAPCDAGISRNFSVTVCRDGIPDWNVLAEGYRRCFHAVEGVNLGPCGLCDVELIFRVIHCFVEFRYAKVLDDNALRMKQVYQVFALLIREDCSRVELQHEGRGVLECKESLFGPLCSEG